MGGCFWGIFLLIAGVAWIIESSSSKKTGGLNNSRYRAQNRVDPNKKYIDAIFVMDAAEHGVFVPGAERVFDELDQDEEGEQEHSNNDWVDYGDDEDYGYDDYEIEKYDDERQ
jgi:hypothetical protein